MTSFPETNTRSQLVTDCGGRRVEDDWQIPCSLRVNPNIPDNELADTEHRRTRGLESAEVPFAASSATRRSNRNGISNSMIQIPKSMLSHSTCVPVPRTRPARLYVGYGRQLRFIGPDDSSRSPGRLKTSCRPWLPPANLRTAIARLLNLEVAPGRFRSLSMNPLIASLGSDGRNAGRSCRSLAGWHLVSTPTRTFRPLRAYVRREFTPGGSRNQAFPSALPPENHRCRAPAQAAENGRWKMPLSPAARFVTIRSVMCNDASDTTTL